MNESYSPLNDQVLIKRVDTTTPSGLVLVDERDRWTRGEVVCKANSASLPFVHAGAIVVFRRTAVTELNGGHILVDAKDVLCTVWKPAAES